MASVELLVTVRSDGTVGEVEVATSAGPELDDAAISAVRGWRFEPARRGEEAVASRIRLSVPMQPPRPPPSGKPADRAAATPPKDSQAAVPRTALGDVVVQGQRQLRTENRSASDFRIDREVLGAAPHQEGAEMLRTAPGMYVG